MEVLHSRWVIGKVFLSLELSGAFWRLFRGPTGYMSGFQPSGSLVDVDLGLRPRLVYVGPLALFLGDGSLLNGAVLDNYDNGVGI